MSDISLWTRQHQSSSYNLRAGYLRAMPRVLDSIHASSHQVLVWEGNNKGFNHFVRLDIRHLYLLDIAMEESIGVLIPFSKVL
jgi:hypothetical protein